MSDTVIVALISLVGTLVPILVTVLTTANKTGSKIDAVEKKLDDHISEDEWAQAKQCRVRILRFNDEICAGIQYSENHYEEILDDIDWYETFCANHKDYHNNKGAIAMANIKSEYTKRKKTNDFLNGGIKE